MAPPKRTSGGGPGNRPPAPVEAIAPEDRWKQSVDAHNQAIIDYLKDSYGLREGETATIAAHCIASSLSQQLYDAAKSEDMEKGFKKNNPYSTSKPVVPEHWTLDQSRQLARKAFHVFNIARDRLYSENTDYPDEHRVQGSQPTNFICREPQEVASAYIYSQIHKIAFAKQEKPVLPIMKPFNELTFPIMGAAGSEDRGHSITGAQLEKIALSQMEGKSKTHMWREMVTQAGTPTGGLKL